jgi:hypothetical protein
MASETLRCSDCNAPLRSVPAWMATAKVKFTCNSCPKRSSRAPVARFDTPLETRASPVGGDPDMDISAVPDMEEDLDADISLEDLDEPKDDKELE